MFTCVHEFAHPPTATIPVSHREHLMRTSTVPEGWFVWIGRAYFGERKHPGNVNHHGILFRNSDDLPVQYSFQSTGFTVGRLLVQTATLTPPSVDAVRLVKFHQAFDVARIHPSSGRGITRPATVFDWAGFYAVLNTLAISFGAKAFWVPLS